MKWRDAKKYKPKHKSYIWIWNQIKQKQELYVSNWVDGDWDATKLQPTYAPMWSYVFGEDEDS